MSKVKKSFLLSLIFLFVSIYSSGQNDLSLSVKNVETGEAITNGSYSISIGGKKLAKGKIMAGNINTELNGNKWVDITIESDGYFTRRIDSLPTNKAFQTLHLIPRNGTWLEVKLNHDLSMGKAIGEMVRFELTDMRSSLSKEVEMQEQNWVAVRLQSDRAYSFQAAKDELELIDPIFINTTGMTSTFLIPREVKMDLAPLEYSEIKEEPFIRSEEVIPDTKPKDFPQKEIAVKPDRVLPEGARKVDVVAIEADMKAEGTVSEEIPSRADVYADFETNTIYFPAGKASLNQQSLNLINAVIAEMQERSMSLRIEVYSDTDMESTIEDYICELRADIVTSYILREGIPFDRLEVSLIGTSILANECQHGVDCSDAKHQANRRVKLILQ